MRLFSTDIDGTVFDGPENAARFAQFWSTLQDVPEAPLLVYNTGRGVADARNLIAETSLPRPDFVICGVGTEIFHEAESRLMSAWHEVLAADWDFAAVHAWVSEQSPARPQPEECQNAYKCSWFWEDADREAVQKLASDLKAQGLRVQAVYSSNRDLDFLPEKANKGNAVSWLARHLQLETSEIIVAGDSANDASMYEVEGVRGVLVANAEEALIEAVSAFSPFRASLPCAAGVVEGLRFLLGDRRQPTNDKQPDS
jgi:sucrose-6F-phosphate phosphohydrolase